MKRPNDDAHGVSTREQAVLERSDAGMAVAAIAAELGLSVRHVRQVVRKYAVDTTAHDLWVAAAAASNAAFLRAVAASGRTFA